jgi:hypothetical protein
VYDEEQKFVFKICQCIQAIFAADAHLVGQFLCGDLMLNIYKPRSGSNKISCCSKGKDKILDKDMPLYTLMH